MVTGGLLTTIDWRWVFFAPVLAGGVLTTSFQFGAALGLAVVAAVLAAADELTIDAFRNGLLVPLIAAVAGVAVAAAGLRVPVCNQMAAKG